MEQSLAQAKRKSEGSKSDENGISATKAEPGLRSELDQLIGQEVQDPVVILFRKWKNPIFLIALIAGLSYFYYVRSNEAFKVSMQNASQLLSESRRLLADSQKNKTELETAEAALLTAQGDEKAKAEKRVADLKAQIAESERVLANKLTVLSESKATYGMIGKSYQALLNAQSGRIDEALQQVANWGQLQVDSTERFYAEVAALQIARLALDQEKFNETGKNSLIKLATEGSVIRPIAALAWTKIASSETDVKAAKDNLEAVLKANPEQSQILEEGMASGSATVQ